MLDFEFIVRCIQFFLYSGNVPSLAPRSDKAVLDAIDDAATAATYLDAVRAAVASAVYASPADVLRARGDNVLVLLP